MVSRLVLSRNHKTSPFELVIQLGLTTNVSSPAESFDHQTTTICNLVPCTLQIQSSAEHALLHPSDCHGVETEQRTLVQSET